ncbi:MAG: MurR/RpiR family transcriptional regulator [Clostridia bacterium]|nr:MurR/RpiR family transcriptional regulator [Clostridia bacterium]
MSNLILQDIKINFEFMSQVEKKIANLIVSDPQKFTTYSLSEVSEIAQVSQGSVINFSNKYSGGGFPSLKLAIAASLAQEQKKTFSKIGNSDSLTEIFHDTAANINDALLNTIETNSEEMLKKAADMILAASKVEIYGFFRSAAVATDFYYQLLQIGIPSTFVSDVFTCTLSASMLDSNSLVIAISSSGQTQELLNAVEQAKKSGASIISITSNRNSPLPELSDVTLYSSPSGNSLTSKISEVRISQLTLTDTLCAYLRGKLDADGHNSYFKMKELLKLLNVKDI